ncbi:hypothetical protein [Tellurirhabdus bombi]|uniref:hypothetical protein n=1 Tax=Tellurirhabdus bombi TaxID=2907205 RepID=UPI001F312658|nr:hypothetical protein [Tellurirhabdus bombi]
MQRPVPLVNSFREPPVEKTSAEPRFKTHATTRPVEPVAPKPNVSLKKRAVKFLKNIPYWIVIGFRCLGWLIGMAILSPFALVYWLGNLGKPKRPKYRRTPDNF